MKVYTEEQVKQMLIKTDMFTPLHIDHIMNETTPIELPSNEEIEKMMEFDEFDPYHVSYLGGAKWMRDKIKGGNK